MVKSLTLSYPQVLKIKKALDERFGVYLHFHDACGGQYFSFDQRQNDEVFDFLSECFAPLGGTLDISTDRLTFAVLKN